MTGWPQADEPSGKSHSSSISPAPIVRTTTSAMGCPRSFARATTFGWPMMRRPVKQLTIEGERARAHRSFDLTRFLQLPGDGEIDIEGLDVEGDTLWLGSHSAVRKRVKDKHDPDQARKALATVEAGQRR